MLHRAEVVHCRALRDSSELSDHMIRRSEESLHSLKKRSAYSNEVATPVKYISGNNNIMCGAGPFFYLVCKLSRKKNLNKYLELKETVQAIILFWRAEWIKTRKMIFDFRFQILDNLFLCLLPIKKFLPPTCYVSRCGHGATRNFWPSFLQALYKTPSTSKTPNKDQQVEQCFFC